MEHWLSKTGVSRPVPGCGPMGVGIDDESVNAAIAQDAKPNDTVICK